MRSGCGKTGCVCVRLPSAKMSEEVFGPGAGKGHEHVKYGVFNRLGPGKCQFPFSEEGRGKSLGDSLKKMESVCLFVTFIGMNVLCILPIFQ